MHKTLIVALVAATALLVPAAAQAATVSLENGAVVYRGEGSEGLDLLITKYQPWGDPNSYLALGDDGADRQLIKAGAPCSMDTNYGAVLCPLDRPLLVEGSEGDDRLSVYDDDTDAVPMTIHGNDGNDEIKDAFGGSAGRVLTGGPGNDVVIGYHGDDTIDGGPGTDTTEEWGIPSDLDRQPRVNVTLDGAANDGRPGEGDNVIGIERIDMSVVGDFTGTEGRTRSRSSTPATTRSQARDGEADTIDCGIGTDTAVVDKIDVVANCETVQGADGNGPPAGAALGFTIKRTKLGALAKKGLAVAVPCPTACTVTGALVLKGKKVGSGRAKGSGTVR